MIRQIRYFQSVVKNNSFSDAAEECHISQSAISQQIQALERELGFLLLERKNRKFVLTPAGEHFYKKSLVLIADFDRICQEAAKLDRDEKAVLRIGYLRSYSGDEFHQALEAFARQYPDVSIQIQYGNHEELYHMLISDAVDIALNDQRRKFADAYVNLILDTAGCSIEVSSDSPLAALTQITPSELKNTPCIIVTSEAQQENEREYYHHIMGFQGDFIYADNLDDARLLVIRGKGFMPLEGSGQLMKFGDSVARIPLFLGDEQVTRNYCAFWKKDNSGYYIEAFAELLKLKYE